MRTPRHPRLTPMRALELLRSLERHPRAEPLPHYLRDEITSALASHVRAGLVRGRRRRRSSPSLLRLRVAA
jgi:hypothetical protein